jgi:hypothetical protein
MILDVDINSNANILDEVRSALDAKESTTAGGGSSALSGVQIRVPDRLTIMASVLGGM